jgi:multidrug efflux pump subunit AcrB
MNAALNYATLVSQQLQSVPEVTNVRVGTELGEPEYVIEVDRERAAAYGLHPRDIVNAIEANMRGRLATQFVAFDRKIPIMVRLPEEARQNLATLQSLRVSGIPIRELIHVRDAVGPVEIQRLDQTRIVRVYADAVSDDMDTAVGAVRASLVAAPPPNDRPIPGPGPPPVRAPRRHQRVPPGWEWWPGRS